jgi:hypothetical protein
MASNGRGCTICQLGREAEVFQEEAQLKRQDTMEAEEGDFVNMEIAFAYRPSTGRGIKSRAKHAHLYLAFYLPGKVKLRELEQHLPSHVHANTV